MNSFEILIKEIKSVLGEQQLRLDKVEQELVKENEKYIQDKNSLRLINSEIQQISYKIEVIKNYKEYCQSIKQDIKTELKSGINIFTLIFWEVTFWFTLNHTFINNDILSMVVSLGVILTSYSLLIRHHYKKVTQEEKQIYESENLEDLKKELERAEELQQELEKQINNRQQMLKHLLVKEQHFKYNIKELNTNLENVEENQKIVINNMVKNSELNINSIFDFNPSSKSATSLVRSLKKEMAGE